MLIAATDDAVIAKRGDEQITISQARALIGSQDSATQHLLFTDRAALKGFLRDVLLQRAILHLAKAEKWDRRPDVAALLQRTHDQALAQSFLAGHVTLPAAYPSDSELRAAYAANIGQFMQPRGYHLVQLFLPQDVTANAEDSRRRLQQARDRIQRDNLPLEAEAKSVGGRYIDLGWVPETQLQPRVKDAVVGLQEGKMADPVCLENGCHLIQLIATRPAGPTPLADLRATLVSELRQQKANQQMTEYASALLLKEPVEVNDTKISSVTP